MAYCLSSWIAPLTSIIQLVELIVRIAPSLVCCTIPEVTLPVTLPLRFARASVWVVGLSDTGRALLRLGVLFMGVTATPYQGGARVASLPLEVYQVVCRAHCLVLGTKPLGSAESTIASCGHSGSGAMVRTCVSLVRIRHGWDGSRWEESGFRSCNLRLGFRMMGHQE
jgi:hypothetical protein